MTRKIVVVYKSDNRDVGESLQKMTDALEGLDVEFIPRENLLEKDTRGSIVIVAGGDGTLLGASHRILDNYSLVLGVRLRNESVGFYTSVDVPKLAEAVGRIMSGKGFEVVRYPRLECVMHTDSGNWVKTDLALNEFLIANTCAYFPSKYTIRVERKDGDTIFEQQRSSGVLVCTKHGYDGWVRWARNRSPVPCWTDDQFLAYVRERMDGGRDEFFVDGKEEKFFMKSDMHKGFIVPDSFDEYHFNRGTEIEVRVSDRPLNLVRFKDPKKWKVW
jgi:NAD+ kinase